MGAVVQVVHLKGLWGYFRIIFQDVGKLGLSKIRGPFIGVPQIRTIIFCDTCEAIPEITALGVYQGAQIIGNVFLRKVSLFGFRA